MARNRPALPALPRIHHHRPGGVRTARYIGEHDTEAGTNPFTPALLRGVGDGTHQKVAPANSSRLRSRHSRQKITDHAPSTGPAVPTDGADSTSAPVPRSARATTSRPRLTPADTRSSCRTNRGSVAFQAASSPASGGRSPEEHRRPSRPRARVGLGRLTTSSQTGRSSTPGTIRITSPPFRSARTSAT